VLLRRSEVALAKFILGAVGILVRDGVVAFRVELGVVADWTRFAESPETGYQY
jgi:hypothetical protein